MAASGQGIDRKALNAAETLSASRLNGGFVPKNLEFGMTFEPHAYDPAKAKKLLAEAAYPNGFDGGDFNSAPPYYSAGEAVAGYIQAVGIRTRQNAGIWDSVWPSGVGPRVAEPAFLLIDPYPWSAPYEELRLKK